MAWQRNWSLFDVGAGKSAAVVCLTSVPARARPWSPPADKLHSASHSIYLPRVLKRPSSRDLKEHVML